jgi:hypothetical protein
LIFEEKKRVIKLATFFSIVVEEKTRGSEKTASWFTCFVFFFRFQKKKIKFHQKDKQLISDVIFNTKAAWKTKVMKQLALKKKKGMGNNLAPKLEKKKKHKFSGCLRVFFALIVVLDKKNFFRTKILFCCFFNINILFSKQNLFCPSKANKKHT